jgi:hypothetical protein
MNQEIALRRENTLVEIMPAVGLGAGTLIGFSRGLMVLSAALREGIVPIIQMGNLEVSGFTAALLVGSLMTALFGGVGLLLGIMIRRLFTPSG